MINTSDVDRFAATLNIPILEEPWQAEWSEKIADEARRNAPVDTGRLRDSIDAVGGEVVVGVRYGVYVEYGTSDTSPQPFIVPAINRLARPAADDLGNQIIRQLT